MNILHLVVFSVVIGLTIATTTTLFAFSATIKCHRPYWCVQLEYIEKDIFSENDKIGNTTWECTYKSQQNILTRGTQQGDGITFLDREYELAVIVKHSCRADGKTVEFVHDLPSRLTEEKFAPVDYTLNLDRR